MNRQLYLVGYDIASSRRRRHARRLLGGHATGGQKSLHECWLGVAERDEVLRRLEGLVDHDTDRVLLVRLDPRARVHTLGRAVEPSDGAFFYQG